ncbi:hypothetical protein NDU88_003931 [Pleurodeles waltl]|uniref:Uncharacterized protein n=1 Tax=Pleurodeles waltl TaxID=8319 RepID=A0AAV7UZV8_PLEWA|nr:hypothetical protein NDU88_003931 [Pleurodeles waltl]
MGGWRWFICHDDRIVRVGCLRPTALSPLCFGAPVLRSRCGLALTVGSSRGCSISLECAGVRCLLYLFPLVLVSLCHFVLELGMLFCSFPAVFYAQLMVPNLSDLCPIWGLASTSGTQ